MKLLEALAILRQQPAADSPEFSVFLACGFTALDLLIFLQAHLRQRLGGRAVKIDVGLFGDLAGNIERLPAGCGLVCIAVEWADLDPRLGWRSAGTWDPDSIAEIVKSARSALERLTNLVTAIPAPVTLSGPTLPLPPLFVDPPQIAGKHHRELQAAVCNFFAGLPEQVRVLSAEALALTSPVTARADIRSEIATGFPYTRTHADALAELFCDASVPAPPDKGLITDLDDTLWKGIVGEDGPAGVAWDLEHHAQLHGLYQKTLSSLAASGVLIGVASKNDPAPVREAMKREDLLISPGCLFPVEARWSPKSESVTQILRRWNIAADSVVFVDDSPMELDEVARAHPSIKTLLFPKDDPAAVAAFLWNLRRRFGKSSISAEDSLRAASLRTEMPSAGISGEEFLAQVNASVQFDMSNPPADDRAFDLVNKTNQFNLNGRRYTAGEWSALLRGSGAFLIVMSYRDRYGPLGRIAVMAGRREGDEVYADSWVMSCRAFSRRIEYQCLAWIYEAFNAGSIIFDFRATDRNRPLQEFFTTICGEAPSGSIRLEKSRFLFQCPKLYHNVEVVASA